MYDHSNIKRKDKAYSPERYAHYKQLMQNGTPRIPVCFCIDTSASMGNLINPDSDLVFTGNRLTKDGVTVREVEGLRPGVIPKPQADELKRVLFALIDGFRADPALCNSVLLSAVRFSRHADTLFDFCEPAYIEQASIRQRLIPDADDTRIAGGLRLCLEKIREMSDRLSAAQTEMYTPVLILITDGVPTDTDEAAVLSFELSSRISRGLLSVFPIGIHLNPAGRAFLHNIRPDGQVYSMDTTDDYDAVFDEIREMVRQKYYVLAADEELLQGVPHPLPETDISVTAYGRPAGLPLGDRSSMLRELIRTAPHQELF